MRGTDDSANTTAWSGKVSVSEDWKRLVHGRPGRRFFDFHQARCARRAGGWPLERILTLSIGTVLLIGGLAIGWLPGPGGFVAVIGAALLGVEWLRVARLLDSVELRTRKIVRSGLRRLRRRDRTGEA
jgi:hypothetical protein